MDEVKEFKEADKNCLEKKDDTEAKLKNALNRKLLAAEEERGQDRISPRRGPTHEQLAYLNKHGIGSLGYM